MGQRYGSRYHSPNYLTHSANGPMGVDISGYRTQARQVSNVMDENKRLMEVDPEVVFRQYMLHKPNGRPWRISLRDWLTRHQGTKFQLIAVRQVKQWIEDYQAKRPYSGIKIDELQLPIV